MKFTKGQELYHGVINDDGTCEIETYIVRTIRKNLVYAIRKASYTWGKVSKKHGDFGWLDPIPTWCREIGTLTNGFYSLKETKLEAWKYALSNVEFLEEEFQAKATRTITNQIARLSKKETNEK